MSDRRPQRFVADYLRVDGALASLRIGEPRVGDSSFLCTVVLGDHARFVRYTERDNDFLNALCAFALAFRDDSGGGVTVTVDVHENGYINAQSIVFDEADHWRLPETDMATKALHALVTRFAPRIVETATIGPARAASAQFILYLTGADAPARALYAARRLIAGLLAEDATMLHAGAPSWLRAPKCG